MIDGLVEQVCDNIDNKASPKGTANEAYFGTDGNIMANSPNQVLDLGISNRVNDDVIQHAIH